MTTTQQQMQQTQQAQQAPVPAEPEVLERLDARLRDAVRREGIDPQRDGALVRRMAEDVVRAHDELSLTR